MKIKAYVYIMPLYRDECDDGYEVSASGIAEDLYDPETFDRLVDAEAFAAEWASEAGCEVVKEGC